MQSSLHGILGSVLIDLVKKCQGFITQLQIKMQLQHGIVKAVGTEMRLLRGSGLGGQFEGGVVVISHDSQLLSVVCDDEERAQVCPKPSSTPERCLPMLLALHLLYTDVKELCS